MEIFFPKKPTKLNDFVQFFSLQVLMSSCFFQNLLPKKSLYAFFFLQFQQSRNRMNKIFKLSFSLQTNSLQKNKKVFPQNILIVFQTFSTWSMTSWLHPFVDMDDNHIHNSKVQKTLHCINTWKVCPYFICVN